MKPNQQERRTRARAKRTPRLPIQWGYRGNESHGYPWQPVQLVQMPVGSLRGRGGSGRRLKELNEDEESVFCCSFTERSFCSERRRQTGQENIQPAVQPWKAAPKLTRLCFLSLG